MECQVPGESESPSHDTVLTRSVQPTNELESSIQALLSAGQMSSSDLQKAEKTALAALDPADVAARQAELRQQRDLMFRAERKAKRVAKIKSKAFRRIHRRAKGKGEEGLSIEDMLELDKLDGGDRVTEEKARMEVARARERATLKHSTKGGRWSKTVGGIEGLDEERNTAVRDMVARGEELRKKIAGVDADDSNDEYAEGDSDEDDANADFDTIRRTAFDELASIDAKDAAAAAAAPKAKGVLGMKFMQDAIAREGRKVEGSANELRRKLERMDEMGQDDDEDEDENSVAMSEQVDGNAGRMVFGPSGTQQVSSLLSHTLEHHADDDMTACTIARSPRRHHEDGFQYQALWSPRHRLLLHPLLSISTLPRYPDRRLEPLARRRRVCRIWQDLSQDEQGDRRQGLSRR